MTTVHANAPAELTDRLPPHDRAAERALLAGILREPEQLHAIRATVNADSFMFDAHQKLFAAIAHLADANAPVDLVTVFNRLREVKQLDDTGGHVALAELWELDNTGANVEYHAGIVRDAATLRAVIRATSETLRDAYDRGRPAPEIVADAQARLEQIAANGQGCGESLERIDKILARVMEKIDARLGSEGRGGLAGLSTGYIDLDDLLGGMRPGQLIIVGARPAAGKTALGTNIAVNVARGGEPVALFSLEMPGDEIGGRLLSMASGVPMHRITRGRDMTEEQLATLTRESYPAGIGGCPIYLDDTPDMPARWIMASCRRAVRRYGIALAVVDYLQLLRPENDRENRVQQVGLIARRMKQMARECNIPVVCMCQLNREVESRPNQEPRLSDLRESGEIEQHADAVLLLHRQPNQTDEMPGWTIDVKVEKNRNGPTGKATLLYLRPVMRFENCCQPWDSTPEVNRYH